MSRLINIIFYGKIIDGKLIAESPIKKKQWENRLRLLEGCDVEYSIKKRSKARSMQQNKYYWAVVVPIISEETGMTEEEVHESLKWKFLRIKGDYLDKSRGISDLTSEEATKFIKEVELWAIEFLGINGFPDPKTVI